jgi:hypothetical protein
MKLFNYYFMKLNINYLMSEAGSEVRINKLKIDTFNKY